MFKSREKANEILIGSKFENFYQLENSKAVWEKYKKCHLEKTMSSECEKLCILNHNLVLFDDMMDLFVDMNSLKHLVES